MPELPEVETVARTLLPHVRNNRIISARLLRPSTLHPLSLPIEATKNALILNTRRRAKLLLLDLRPVAPDGPTLLLAHLRMTGKFLPVAACEMPHKHTRCAFQLENAAGFGQQLFFDDTRAFGKLLLCREETLEKWEFWRTLGPEPLTMTADILQQRLCGRRPIKSALLDQKVLVGIGNIYADESLFAAGIAPTRPANSLTKQECSRLLAAIQKILNTAIDKRGSSIRDYRDANGQSGGFQENFFAYGRGGQNCKNCGATLIREKIGGRGTVYCPQCQK